MPYGVHHMANHRSAQPRADADHEHETKAHDLRCVDRSFVHRADSMFIGKESRHPHGCRSRLGSRAEQGFTIAMDRFAHTFEFDFLLSADSTVEPSKGQQDRDRS